MDSDGFHTDFAAIYITSLSEELSFYFVSSYLSIQSVALHLQLTLFLIALHHI